MRFLRWLKTKLVNGLKHVTYFVSRSVTATVTTLGALIGLTTVNGNVNIYRPGIALMVFSVGLIPGLIIFGSNFSLLIWMAIVLGVLFLMNLHNVWETIISLKYGGLDYVMATQAVAAAESVTPDEDDIADLNQRVKELNFSLRQNAERPPIFQDGIIRDKMEGRKKLVPCADPSV